VNLVGCGIILVFVDSTGKPNGGEEIFSPMVSLDMLEGAVSIESEESVVDADGDSDLVIGTVHGCWSMSGLGLAYGLILPVL
jgi:hypothetical protein